MLRRRSRREWLSAGLVLGGVVGFVVLVYLVVVVLGGLLLGHTSSPHLGLSVLATAIVAVAFDAVLTRLEDVAARVVHRGRPSPYDAMRRFAGAVDVAGPAEELPLWMARLLAEATGAQWVRVWVAIDGQRVTAATWPPGARRTAALGWDLGTRRLPVRHGDEELGMLVLREREGTSLTPVEERLFEDLAAQGGRPGRGPPPPGARHPRRRPAAPGRAGGQPAAGGHAGRYGARPGRRAPGRSGGRRGRRPGHPAPVGQRHLPDGSGGSGRRDCPA